MHNSDCEVWSVQLLCSPCNNFWPIFHLHEVLSKTSLCADFATSLLDYRHSFHKEACQCYFCSECSRFNTFLVALLSNYKPLMGHNKINMKESWRARGIRLSRLLKLKTSNYAVAIATFMDVKVKKPCYHFRPVFSKVKFVLHTTQSTRIFRPRFILSNYICRSHCIRISSKCSWTFSKYFIYEQYHHFKIM